MEHTAQPHMGGRERCREAESHGKMSEREEEKGRGSGGVPPFKVMGTVYVHRDHTRSGYCLPCAQGDRLCHVPKGQGQVCLDANIPLFCLLKKMERS